MAEKVLKSYDPLAYYVNNVSNLDPSVVKAHVEKDDQLKKDLLARGSVDFDIFICINKHSHAIVLCVNIGNPDEVVFSVFSEDPHDVPEHNFCWVYHLCYENVQLKTYQISKDFKIFKDIKHSIKSSFYIGRYKKVPPIALQFAALRAAPHRYNALLNDCVEFAKEFCVALLSYCNNGLELEQEVGKRIKDASATGLSIERLSRNVRSSGMIGSSFLGGIDASNFLGNHPYATVVCGIFIIFLLFVYPVVVAIVAVKYMK